uniref:GRIP1-associated protein 1 isoform X3 n=1 Tax=Geotrypetes seraphini TaxID=260995 RepID=A0A6P8PU16_GEOSA|nr:GRIP1-associated protein 1 isoform X3 [Geotrypetes seraphini]
MAQALSEEEFQRLQGQLLELRTQNYQLSDELRKNSTELTGLRQKLLHLEKEYAKSQKALSKSKKAQEVEALLSENEMLQGKLHSQEDDFRLQNSTLMQELSKLCSQIEQLEVENHQMKGVQVLDGSHSVGAVDGELLRLQAENTTLQKNLTALQERLEKELPEGAKMNGHVASPGAVLDQQMNQSTGDKHQEPGGSPLLTQLEDIKSSVQDQRWKELQEVELKWEMEKEEKRLLKEQLQALELMKQGLQEELSKTSEKLKKKQESFQRLQLEKEALYNDSRTKIDEIQQRKEEELKSLTIRNQKLQQDLQTAQQIQTSKTQEMNLLREQNAELEVELRQQQGEKEGLLVQRDDLQTQLQESVHANSRLLEQLQEQGQEKEKLQQDLEEMRKSAEKRKAMLDQMAIERQREQAWHKEEVGNVKLQHEKEVLGIRAKYEKELRELHEEKHRGEEELKAQLKEEKARSRELVSMQQTVEELRLQIQSLEGTKGWFERRLKESEDTIEKNQREHEKDVRRVQEQQVTDLQRKEQEVEEVKMRLEEAGREKEECLNTITRLQQEIKDTVDGQRILEKKGSAALKDLKRQLHLERKRADKLQERLQDILTNSKTRTGIEDLVLAEISSPSRTQTGDSSSISSFSYREIMKESTASTSNKSNTSSPQSQQQRPADLSDEEISDLFQRLAEIQQEKWLLEEKVKHLEVSSASMAEDLCRKSAIIETYVMDSRIDVSAVHGPSDRSSIGSVLRDLVKPGDENLREMNKKLQNMLEEQLTKNMHLQKDLEVLSQEIVRLSKECIPSLDKDQDSGSTS